MSRTRRAKPTPILVPATFHFSIARNGRPTLWEPGDDGRPVLEVVITTTLIGGRLDCVGIDFKSFTQGTRNAVRPLPGATDISPIYAKLVREIPLGDLIDRAIHNAASTAKWAIDANFLPAGTEGPWEDIAGADSSTPKRGPKPSMTADLLRDVVAPAYLTGGRKPVQAVQQALEAADFPGSNGDGTVSIDQARKAVQQARRDGFIPPATKKGKP